MPTDFEGTITWLGRVVAKPAALPEVEAFAGFAGVEGEVHAGLKRPSCSRVTGQYPRGTEIRNVRQFSVLSAEELAMIARDMGLAQLDPSLLGRVW